MTQREDWNVRVERIVRTTTRRGILFFVLGLVTYGGGSALILATLWQNPTIATVLVMSLFQCLVMGFGTMVIYPCIGGGFRLTIEANRDAVPAFEKLAEAVESEDSKKFLSEGRAAFADMREAVKGVKLEELKLTFERKVDELKDTIEESFGANDPVLSQAEIDEMARKARTAKTGAK